MRISVNQLARWIGPGAVGDVEELAHRLTMVGLEVEEVVHVGRGHDDIVVGRIVAIEDHPSADRLVVCRVDVGDGSIRQIVCGATNMSEGDLVPVALPGSRPPALDFEIGSRKVAGVMSDGMLCAEEELGLAAESDGLWILPGELELGVPVFEATGTSDAHLEIGLTPNRPDCLSHLGVAREVAAIRGERLDESSLDRAPAWESGSGDVADVASLEVKDSEGCPRYVAAVLEDVKVRPSPDWLRKMVVAMGMRSINNVVDVTNVVLADIGQPLHAFDLDRLAEQAIVVRRARAGEKLEAIDHKTYELTADDLVIADSEKPVAIAGVMGGVDTEVTEQTTRILLECAYFQPTTVRKTSKRLGIHSESSHRFERGIDPAATLRNAAYAVELLLRTQDDDVTVRRGVLEHHPDPVDPRRISLPRGLVKRILGIEIAGDDIVELLGSIRIEATQEGDRLEVVAPTFRPDLERPIDIVEEIARLHGYEAFEARLPRAPMGAAHRLREQTEHPATIVSRAAGRKLWDTRTRLLAAGFHETVTYSFMSEADLELLGLPEGDSRRRALRVANPLTQDQEFMRTTIVPAHLRALADNVAQRNVDMALFEIVRRFDARGDAGRTLSILATGVIAPHFESTRRWDLFDLKGLLESLLGDQSASHWVRPSAPEPYLHPGVQATWCVGDQVLGTVGQLHPLVLHRLDVELEAPVWIAEIDFEELVNHARKAPTFEAYPRFPAVRRDFALLYDREADWAALEQSVSELARSEHAFGAIYESMRLFDVYQGEQVPEGKRSVAIEVVYRSSERTLTDAEVAAADEVLLTTIARQTGATLR